jgi:glycosyltransferase involved in cell wall biosynthesis
MTSNRPHILMLSYHFPPLDVVASARSLSFAKHLPANGIDVTVLTINWDGQNDIEESREYKLLAIGNQEEPKWPAWTKWPLVSKFIAMSQYQKGIFEPHVRWHEKAIDQKAQALVESGDFDLVLGMFSPHFHIKQCKDLFERFGIPYVVDFRDMWANRVMETNYQPGSNARTKDGYFKGHWKRWMSDASGFTTVAEAFRKKISEITGKEGMVIHNGFDDSYPTREPFQEFTISHIGNLLAWKNIDPFVEGLQMFSKHCDSFKVRFVGASESLKQRIQGAFESAGILRHLDFIDRVSSAEARQEMVNTNVLYYPPIEGFKGMYSAKVFEYLGSGTPILSTPNDHDVIEKLMSETNGGQICGTPSDVCEFLKKELDNSSRQNDVETSQISTYSRKAQAANMARYLIGIIEA